MTVEKVLFPAHSFQPTTVFFDLDQINSKECLYFQLSNTFTIFCCCFLAATILLLHISLTLLHSCNIVVFYCFVDNILAC